MKRCWLLLGLMVCLGQAMANPQVRVEARLQPAPPYQTGSTLRLEVDLLTTTWFTQAPQPAPLDLPGALISPPNGLADKLTESIDGTPYFGLRLTYLISPMQAGDFTIPALPFSLRLGQADTPIEVSSQGLSFNVSAGTPSTASDHLLVSRLVSLQQRVEQSAKPLKVGDRLTRRIQIQARDAQAMLIPPTVFADIPGLKRYPQPPEISVLSDGRGSTDGGQRIDSVSYVVESSGHYTLPAIEVAWWDSNSQQPRSSSVPAIEFEAESAEGFVLPFSLQADLEKLGRGRLIRLSSPLLLLTGAILLLGTALYFGRTRLRAAGQQVQARHAQIRARWLASEAFAWRALQHALRRQALPLAELYRWQARIQGVASLQLLASQLPPAAAASLRQALTDTYNNQQSTTEAAPAALRQGLQHLRRLSKQQERRQTKLFRLQPLRPWPAHAAAQPGSINTPDRPL